MKAEYWFVAEGSAGFTSDPNQAKKARNGSPIACPATLSQVWKAHFKKDKDRQEAIWDMLLDEMEKFYELTDPQNNHADHELGQLLLASVDSLERSLAVLKYGVVNDDSMKAVKTEAIKRYDA